METRQGIRRPCSWRQQARGDRLNVNAGVDRWRGVRAQIFGGNDHAINRRQVEIGQGDIDATLTILIARRRDGDGRSCGGIRLGWRRAATVQTTALEWSLNDQGKLTRAVVHAQHPNGRNRTQRTLHQQGQKGQEMQGAAPHG